MMPRPEAWADSARDESADGPIMGLAMSASKPPLHRISVAAELVFPMSFSFMSAMDCSPAARAPAVISATSWIPKGSNT